MPQIKEREELAVITCFFTPSPHPSRARNFETFRQQFRHSLYVAELAFGQQPWLTPKGPRVLHFRGETRHVMWQKERLLNAVIVQLPRRITHVAWVDSDIMFQDPDWPQCAIERMTTAPVIQLFDSVICLDSQGFPDLQLTGTLASGGHGTTGFAWAARREILANTPLLDFMIVGGADACMSAGYAGNLSPAIRAELPRHLRRSVDGWLKKAAEATGGKTGYLPGTIEHLFHGNFSTRDYLGRYELLRKADFNPMTDLFLETMGLYAWSAAQSFLAKGISQYFAGRATAENAS